MKNKMIKKRGCRKGFTLIELLVVVLIVGILAAVAMPRYKKIIYNMKYQRLKRTVTKIIEAEELYFLANGRYSAFFSQIDIDTIPEPVTASAYKYTYNGWECELDDRAISVTCQDDDIGMKYKRNFPKNGDAYSDLEYCMVTYDNKYGYNKYNPADPRVQICAKEWDDVYHSTSGGVWYSRKWQ